MATIAKTPYQIPPDLRTKLLAQLTAAKATQESDSTQEAKKAFIEHLEVSDLENNRCFAGLTKPLVERLENNNIRLNQLSKELIEQPNTNAKLRRNLLEFLFQTRKFLTDDFAFLYRADSLKYTTEFIASKKDAYLSSALANIQLSGSSLNGLAKALLEGRTLEQVEDILRAAYGTGESSLSDALKEPDLFSFELRPHHVRRTLQALLVEVFREGLPQNREEFNRLTEMYLNGEFSSDRANVATLLKEKFQHEALEFFQNLAMNESSSTDNLDIRLEAITEYARMKPDNVTETLWSIISNSKDPRVIFRTLSELANSGKLILDELINRIKSDDSKPLLFTLLKLTNNSIESLFNTIRSSAQNFFEGLLIAVPNLKEKLSSIDSDWSSLEFEGGPSFDSKPELGTDAPSPIPVLDKVLNALHPRTLINSLLFGNTPITRNNAADLLSEVPDEQMKAFHQAGYCKPDREATAALKQALGLQS